MSFLEENPKAIFDNIKELLNIGAKDRHHAFHIPVFSTHCDENSVDSRVVVLRKFDQDNLILNFNTDYRSPKIKNLKKNNKSNFVFYDYRIKIQLRIKTISKIHYDDEITKITWEKTRLASRKCYLSKNSPSSITNIAEDSIPIHLKGINPNNEESQMGYKNFTVIENTIKEIDWLYLASSGHRRLKISFNNIKPIFEWLVP
tara:strand:+ start:947 stop:1552 length:606 start_codon:yes stop_codon:yes gene_type:complete